MSIKKLTMTALLTAAALIIYLVEVNIPSLTPIPGIKLGLANIVSIFALYITGPYNALCVLLARIFLGSIFSGQVIAMIYSLSGGLLSFSIIALIRGFFKISQIWIVSVIGAITHNIGQIIAAVIITGTPEITIYLPVLIISGIITGAFTGLAAQVLTERLIKLGLADLYVKKKT